MNRLRAAVVVATIAVAAGALGQQVQIASVDEIAAWLAGGKDAEAGRAARFIIRQQWTAAEAQRLNDVLLASLRDRSELDAKSWAICQLAQQHPAQLKPSLQAIISLLDIGHLTSGKVTQLDACSIADALGSIGQHAVDAVPSLQAIMKAEQRFKYASIKAAAALARIQPDDISPINWLQSRLSTQQSAAVIVALGAIGPGAKSAVPSLEKLLQADDEVARTLAAVSLWKIEGKPRPAAIKVLCAAILEEPQSYATTPWGPSPPGELHNIFAALSLRSMATQAESAIPDLLHIQATGTQEQQRLTSLALETIQPAK